MNLASEFIFDNFQDPMKIHAELFKMIRSTGFVTYGDLLYMIEQKDNMVYPKEYYDYGWTNLWEAKVEPFKDEGDWILRMPKIKRLTMKKELFKY